MDCCPLAKFEACLGNKYSFKYNVACRIIDRARKRYIRFQCKIESIIEAEWQKQYSESSTARLYKQIEPTVSKEIKFVNNKKGSYNNKAKTGKVSSK